MGWRVGGRGETANNTIRHLWSEKYATFHGYLSKFSHKTVYAFMPHKTDHPCPTNYPLISAPQYWLSIPAQNETDCWYWPHKTINSCPIKKLLSILAPQNYWFLPHKTDHPFLSQKTEHPFMSPNNEHPFMSYKSDHPFHFLHHKIDIHPYPTKTDHLFMPHKKWLSIHVPQTSHSFPNQRDGSWLPPVLVLCSPGSRCRSASSCPHSPEITVSHWHLASTLHVTQGWLHFHACTCLFVMYKLLILLNCYYTYLHTLEPLQFQKEKILLKGNDYNITIAHILCILSINLSCSFGKSVFWTLLINHIISLFYIKQNEGTTCNK